MQPKLIFENDAIRNRISDGLKQVAHFSTKNPINKPTMNNRRILVAAVFHFVHPVERTVQNITRWHKTLPASAISKYVSRCCINFPHDLTCQRYRWAWASRDHGEESQKQLPSLAASKNWLNFRVRSQFEIKSLKMWPINTTYFLSTSFPPFPFSKGKSSGKEVDFLLIKKNWSWTCDRVETSN